MHSVFTPPPPTVLVQEQVAVVRVAGKAKRYRVQIKAAGAWRRGAQGPRRTLRLRLDPGRYKVRAAVKRHRWSPYGRASAWFRIAAPTPTPTPPPDPSPVTYPGREIWVDASNGSDSAAGTQAAPIRTVREAWRRIPENVPEAIVVKLLPGTHTVSPGYWENRRGQPIAIVAANGPGTASMTEDINMFGVHNLTIDGLRIHRAGDVFHCEQCYYVTLRNVDFDGQGAAHETIKVNQSQHFDILTSRISGAYENAIDYVAVQWSTIAGNDISHGEDWCAYVKGGSAHVEVRDNRIHDCGTGGFTAGQGTGFEFMVAPWLTYEAMYVRVLDNTIYDTEGAGLGVNGGYHIRMSGNVLFRTGSRSHNVEFVLGHRSCDGDTAACQARHDAGGWGGVGIDGQYIPNKDVWFGNNIIDNPQASRWQVLQVADPTATPPSSNVPSPALADEGLVITNNIFWNPVPDVGYPIDSSNRINTLDPQVDPTTVRPAVTLPSVPVPD